ncbi:glycosyltransferase [Rhizobacter sp. AJA081-3]|nr:glycosyltransferase [Rhizobacter sp. AJA081-3]QTN24255.1 glycosyltransferase [Rhizobacter sp. AJA081-3]
MAAYNGVRYLREQVQSILAQLGPDDELVVVDDASTDETLALLRSFGDPRIHVHRNAQNLGHVQSFARALSLARHDLLLMSDQDDVWLPERLALMRSALVHPNAWVVSTNSRYIDGEGKRINFDAEGVCASRSTHHFANIISIFTGRRRYYGCAMGLRREILPIVLPIPDFVESHDLWIALASNLARANLHLDCETLSRRVHGSNASIVTRPFRQKLWSRVIFLKSLAVLLYRLLAMREVASRPVPL